MKSNKAFLVAGLSALFVLSGCTTTNQAVLGMSQSQVQLRNMQSRYYDTTDRDHVVRAVIATMQDLGFIIDKADYELGTVSGTNYSQFSKLTVSIRVLKDRNQTLVRSNAQVGVTAIEDPVPYRNFYAALSKSLFLAEHEVE